MSEVESIVRTDFPVFKRRDVVYLDNGATTQKPLCVIEAVNEYYKKNNANPLRGLYELSIDATDAYENARKAVARFINAPEPENIVFVRNATEALNLVAYSYGMNFIKEDEEIIITIAEHHSNMLPWREVAKHTGAKLTYFECEPDGSFSLEKLQKLISKKKALVAMTMVSNVFGRLNDIKTFAKIAHDNGAVFVADGAQGVPHVPVDVTDLDVDFLAFSGHKMYAPMGIGALYGKGEILEKMPPFMFGGEMIEYVTRDDATYAEVPHKFEAGTVNAGGAVGLHEAIHFMERFGWDTITSKEDHLTKLAFDGMKKIPHVHIIGSDDPMEHHGIITFTIDGVHPHDVAAIFDANNIAVRAGHHCAQPLMQFLGVNSTTRASFAFYNTEKDVEVFLDCLSHIREEMGYEA